MGDIPAEIGVLYDRAAGVYLRAYPNGSAPVNPGERPRPVALERTCYLVMPVGSEDVAADGALFAWRVDYTAVTSVTLRPGRGAVLLNRRP